MPKHQRLNMGTGGYCVCPKCGYKITHKSGVPCQEEHCPQCNSVLLREDSEHHRMFQRRHGQ
jgi:hypothetical protein